MRVRPEMLPFLRVARRTERYAIISDGAKGEGIWCARCHSLSYNQNDVKQRWCGWCHAFHDDPAPPPPPEAA